MKALTIVDSRLVLQERPDPDAGPGDVIVSVRSAGLNAADLLQRRGLYPAPAGWPGDVPGLELSGVVSAVGPGVDASLVGRRVCAIVGGGAQATLCRVPAAHLMEVPDEVGWIEAGAVAEAVLTAHDALVRQGELAPGQRVLISGAAGGVGTAAVQIARSLGAHVIALTRDDAHHERLRELGAHETITIASLPELDPVDVVLELVGAAHLEHALRIVARSARVVVIGVAAGSRIELDLLQLMNRQIVLTGSTLRSRAHDEKAVVTRRGAELLVPRWRDGEFSMPVAQRFDLTDAEAAYDAFAQRGKFGKIVMTTGEW